MRYAVDRFSLIPPEYWDTEEEQVDEEEEVEEDEGFDYNV